jgi:hypothetical protein
MMTIRYIVKSDRRRTVTGLGVLEEGEERTFTEQEAQSFLTISGLPLKQGNVPEGVEVTVFVVKEEK